MRDFTFEPDWEDGVILLYYNPDKDAVEYSNMTHTRYGLPYFKSKDQAQACIDAIGEERLKKYYFGIRE